MPRTFNIPAGTYPAGVYGPYSVDSFTNANTDALVLTLPTAGWPTEPGVAVLRASLVWDTGGGAAATFYSNPVDRAGQPLEFVVLRVGLVKEGPNVRKRSVGRGDLTVEVLVPSLSLAAGGTLAAV